MFEPTFVALSADDVAWGHAFFRGDKTQPAIIRACHQNHALALDAAEFAWGEVDQKRDLPAHDLLWGEVLGDAADDSAGVQACVDGELQKLVGLGDLFAFKDGSDTEVQFGEVVEGDFVFGGHEVSG